jgi:hypothetical protein
MSRIRHVAALGSAALLVAAGVFALRAVSRAHEAESRVARARVVREQWAESLAASKAPADRAPDARRSTADSTEPPSPANTSPGASRNEDASNARQLRALRASARLQFGRLLLSLSLPPEQADAFLQGIAAHHRTLLMLSDSAQDTRPSLPSSIASENARFEAEVKALLGEPDYEKYREFQRTLPLWRCVTELAVQLYDTPTPLTPPQAEQLAGVLIGGATNARGQIASAPADWNAALGQAAAFLSAPQLEMLSALKDRRELMLRLNRMIARETRDNH